MSKWNYLTLDEMGEVSRGRSRHRPRNDSKLYGGKYPFIQTGDVGSAGLYINKYSQTYNEEGLAQSKLWAKDTLCITIAANIADTGLLAFPACFPDSIMGFTAKKGVSNVKFVKYSFDILQKECQLISQGAAQDNLSWKKLSTIKFPCPPIEVQDKIVEVLYRYDSLIENYQKQIKLLEEAAQRLYKEWFIDLHFPGHENTNIIDGVPEGWEKKKLIDLVNVQYGYAFDGHLFNSKGEGTPIVRIRNIPDGYTNDYTTEEANESYIVNDGDLLIGMDGIFHINTWCGGKAYLVQRACSFRPKDVSMKGFILQAIFEPIKFFENTVVGATVAHLGKKHIDSIELLVSNNDKMYKPFEKMFNERQTLKSQLRLLTEARDRLLPKLMNCEINV